MVPVPKGFVRICGGPKRLWSTGHGKVNIGKGPSISQSRHDEKEIEVTVINDLGIFKDGIARRSCDFEEVSKCLDINELSSLFTNLHVKHGNSNYRAKTSGAHRIRACREAIRTIHHSRKTKWDFVVEVLFRFSAVLFGKERRKL